MHVFIYSLNNHRPESLLPCTGYIQVNRPLPSKGLQTKSKQEKLQKHHKSIYRGQRSLSYVFDTIFPYAKN